jgi:septin family protein
MKRLDKCVNIIPVIAKSDTLTLEEREAFKRRVSTLGLLLEIYSAVILFFTSVACEKRELKILIIFRQ